MVSVKFKTVLLQLKQVNNTVNGIDETVTRRGFRTPPLLKGITMEEKLTGNPKPSGNISDYNSIEEKEEMCKDMAGYNESLTVNYQQDKIKKIGEKK